MPDEMDHTQEVCDRLLEDSLADHFRQRRKAPRISETSGLCIDCEDEIPAKRRLAVPDCNRCVTCQAGFELLDHWRAL